MITVTLQREKCIGCNYCTEHALQRFPMAKKDGKAVLIGSQEKKGIFVVKIHEQELESCMNAAKTGPVKIIKGTE